MVKRHFSTEQLTERWEDRRAVKNLMGKYVVSFLIKKERDMFKTFWSERDDICLGIGEGWFSGPEAVSGYYMAIDERNIAVRDLLMELFPEKAGGKSEEELYGIGVFDLSSITNSVVEIASDGETAKGMWHCFGRPVDVTERGPLSYWVFGTYAADFIKEDGQWRLWHVQYLEDIKSPNGYNWSEGKNPYPPLPEFAPLAEVKVPTPNVPVVLRERYSVNRPFAKLPDFPEPYDTFAETFSYGM